MLIAWGAPVVAAMAAGLWLYFNIDPRYGRNLHWRIEPAEIDDAELPAVVIVVPGRNEAEHLPTSLAELCEQDYPDLLVIFVDDASTDATPAITAELKATYGERLEVVRNDVEPPAGWVGK
ncbi:MAG: glycosyltransferase, partial [Planctomycetota bacterium]